MKGDKIYYYDRGSFYVLSRTYTVDIGIFPDEDIETEYVSLSKNGTLIIRLGYAWDGPSGPTINTKSTLRTSLIHDATFQLFRLGVLDMKWFHKANDNLRDIGIEDGMWKWRAEMWHSKVVQNGMKDAATNKKYEKELIAP